jgi:tRNA(fMet)-specific endonuclease VapC
MYLLDTNILSDAIKNPRGFAGRRLTREDGNACTSIIVASELRFGAIKSGARVLARKVDELLESLPVLPFASPADDVYGQVRTQLERDGKPIGANDMLIAAHALALGCTLVSDNLREFARVPSLRVENWLR